MSFVNYFELSGNPFEHYTAETEPNISDYAIHPPYLNPIIDRSFALSSFTLFGERGAGKSATRITVYNEIWSQGRKDEEGKFPLAVNLTDFSQILVKFQKGTLTDRDLVALVAFSTIEKLLAWLSSLSEEDRSVYLNGLDAGERTLTIALLEAFYLTVPELDRDVSTTDSLKILNSAWTTKSQIWISARWDSISKIFASTLSALSRKKLSEDMDIEDATEKLLRSLKSESGNAPRAILSKLVDLARAFGFSGICVLVDKVDETPATSNSAEATGKMVLPIFDHIQLLEVEGVSWLFFLWSNTKTFFEEKTSVRLDKIPHTSISWSAGALREMLDRRIMYYSNQRFGFSGILEDGLDPNIVFDELSNMAMRSPRELIKLLDIVIREYDAGNRHGPISGNDIKTGVDKYVVENVWSWYPRKMLHQIFRLGKIQFVNVDLQSKFRIGHQGARNRIIAWEGSGAVIQDGTVPSELGGKHVHRYLISDAKVPRIIEEKLLEMVGEDLEQPDQDGEIEENPA